MQLDVEDIFAGVFSSILGRWLLFIVAVWIGCWVGLTGLVAGSYSWGGRLDIEEVIERLALAPTLLLSLWGVLNVPFLLFSFIYFIRSESVGYKAWGIVIGVESLTVMAGWARYKSGGGWELLVAWLAWLVVLVMVETGVWLIAQMVRNRWARQLDALRSENAQRNAAAEAERRGPVIPGKQDLADDRLISEEVR
jgi:hypothetical protein